MLLWRVMGSQALNYNEIRFPLACTRGTVAFSCKSCEGGFSKIDLTKKKKTKNAGIHFTIKNKRAKS